MKEKEAAGVASPGDSEEFEKCLRMLQVHNAKVDKIRGGYTNYCLMREQAVLEGVTI